MSEEMNISTRVLDALVVAGVLTTDQLLAARSAVDESGMDTGEVLLEQGAFTEQDLAAVLERELGVPRIDLASYAPDEDALQFVPASLALEYEVVPLFEIEGTLTVAVGSPGDVFALDALGRELGVEIEAVLADPMSVAEALRQCYETRQVPEAVTAYAEWPESADLPGMVLAEEAAVGEAAAADEEAAAEEYAFDEEPAATAEPAVAGEAATAGEVAEFEVAAEPEGTAELEVAAEPEGTAELEVAEVEEAAEPKEAPDEVPAEAPEASASTTEVQATGPVDEILEDLIGPSPVPLAPRDVPLPSGAEAAGPPEPVSVREQLDLDVLAVADLGRVAMLVSEIVRIAVARGASDIHVLPYKHEFFLVLRVGGRLEQLGRAPISLEAPLVEGLLAYVGATPPTADGVVVSRARIEVSGREVVLGVSMVPTVAGRRLVVGIGAPLDAPRALEDLGMNEAEAAALGALAERGRGLVIVASPIGGGRSETYHSVLARAAFAGRTVYSVERSMTRQIDAIAQVAANPGADAARYLAAGLLQDTDVMGLDSATSLEEVHLALEASHAGKLVVLTLVAGGAAEGLARLLALGVDPTSLASELVIAVGQRIINTVCPQCAVPDDVTIGERLPGLAVGSVPMVGMGCDACGRTGLGGSSGLFELLPVTDPLRTVLARGGSADAIEEVALAAGMRSLAAAGVAQVESGLVSVGELDRALRIVG